MKTIEEKNRDLWRLAQRAAGHKGYEELFESIAAEWYPQGTCARADLEQWLREEFPSSFQVCKNCSRLVRDYSDPDATCPHCGELPYLIAGDPLWKVARAFLSACVLGETHGSELAMATDEFKSAQRLAEKRRYTSEEIAQECGRQLLLLTPPFAQELALRSLEGWGGAYGEVAAQVRKELASRGRKRKRPRE